MCTARSLAKEHGTVAVHLMTSITTNAVQNSYHKLSVVDEATDILAKSLNLSPTYDLEDWTAEGSDKNRDKYIYTASGNLCSIICVVVNHHVLQRIRTY